MTEKKLSEFKSWDEYAKEAEHEPFVLPISEKKSVKIEVPTGHRLIQFNRAQRTGDAEAMLIMLCGDAWEEIESLVLSAGHKAMESLMIDIMEFFDLVEAVTLVGPGKGDKPGPVKTVKDPRQIAKLLNQGYRPMGEAVSRT